MKFLNLILIILLYFFNQSANAGEPEYAIIETKSGERIEADIDTYEEGIIVSQGSKLHYSIDGEKHKINYKEIKTVSLVNRTYEIISFKKEMRSGSTKRKVTITHIAELIVEENVKLFNVYEILTSQSNPNSFIVLSSTKLGKRNFVEFDNEVIWVSKSNFKQTLKKIYGDCERMMSKIKEKEFKYTDIEEAVRFGNHNCRY